MDQLTSLNACDLTNTPVYNLNGDNVCKVLYIVDGDTFRGAMETPGNHHYLFTFRCHGINAPELHPRLHAPNRTDIVERAIKAKQFLVEKINNKVCKITIHGMDCFGRLLTTIFVDGESVSVNDQMLRDGLVVSFMPSTSK